MPAPLVWDQTGERFYEAGVDRGVLYGSDGVGVAWNGLISVVDKSIAGGEASLYFDGVKYSEHVALSEFSGTLRAYTYPDEFLEYEGVSSASNGLFITGQPIKRFGLCYRTKIGNDEEGLDHGYKLHLLYNLMATPSPKTYNTQNAGSEAIPFEWNLTAIPGDIPGRRPTAHLILDTRYMSPILLADLEKTLYGSTAADARLPPISTLVSFIDQWVIIRITDNFDGTWTAEGPDEMIIMLDDTTFEINPATATYLDENTYVISDTTY